MPLASTLLPVALAIVMFGLGLTLTLADFTRVVRFPKAVFVALACQIIVLPLLTFGIVALSGLPPLLAIGMMLIVSAPGGAIANVLSHVFGGDVALNISLTAVNSVTAIFTIPLIVNLSIAYFDPSGGQIGLQFQKTLEVTVMVLGPVALGMLIRRFATRFALAMDKPVRIVSMVILAAVITLTVIGNLAVLAANLGPLLLLALLICVMSLLVGFFVPRLFRVSPPQSLASSLEIGLHNATIALVIGQVVLANPVIAVPAAVYGPVSIVLGLVAAIVFRSVIRRTAGNAAPQAEPAPAPQAEPEPDVTIEA
ncbi:bile acid:sodium symporter family protein [Agromyces sp. GXS1127]|uniref:bile acid:sodium symporter family protein n=1 Tax=Agromyces sp. GXS1127 TaxID=3424181 RepID=UPI003D313A1D